MNPIDFKEDIEKYEAKETRQEISYPHCLHKEIKLNPDRTELRCPCGVAYTGSQLGTLYTLLTQPLDKPL